MLCLCVIVWLFICFCCGAGVVSFGAAGLRCVWQCCVLLGDMFDRGFGVWVFILHYLLVFWGSIGVYLIWWL